ncbi:hypothetical protein ACSDR0_05810 [Streptosporangium sp. G11]|uniref:hypothetical protein n=1 Tax=Streptosporangium sp. G11 TaxID=3436926 RepID=UPI003EB89D94
MTVYDSGQGPVPALTCSALLDESGRGLPLVTALASRVGCHGSQAHGHAVWAQFTGERLPASQGHDAGVRHTKPAGRRSL